MNYRKDFERCLDFIEENITQNLNSKVLSDYLGYSLFHFCRLFQIYKGMSPMEYIRRRRLDQSLLDILSGEKIINISLKYGFETPSGYSKAFRREYGTTPTDYAKKMKGYNYKVPHLDDGFLYIHPPKIISIPAFEIAGYGIQTDIAADGFTEQLIAYWHDFEAYAYEEKMYEILNPQKHGEIGVIVPQSLDSGQSIYLCGVRIDDHKQVLDDMVSTIIPDGLYAVFSTPPTDMRDAQDSFAKSIKKTWAYIFSEWPLDYQYDQSRFDFEYYDERCHYLENSTMDIYIPIK